jgi:hypothetical protein
VSVPVSFFGGGFTDDDDIRYASATSVAGQPTTETGPVGALPAATPTSSAAPSGGKKKKSGAVAVAFGKSPYVDHAGLGGVLMAGLAVGGVWVWVGM